MSSSKFLVAFAAAIVVSVSASAQDAVCSADQRDWDVLSAYESDLGGLVPWRPDNSILERDGLTNGDTVERLGFFLGTVFENEFLAGGAGGFDFVPLCAFAQQADLLRLEGEVGVLATNVEELWQLALETQAALDSFETLAGELRRRGIENRDGVAMSFAMSGIGALTAGEQGAFSGNIGAFNGATGFALGGATRVSEHLSFSAAFAYADDSDSVGGRAGFRVSW
jgi:hypothetical protein